jgi:hypothetical protein
MDTQNLLITHFGAERRKGKQAIILERREQHPKKLEIIMIILIN